MSQEFICERCNFIGINQSRYDRHIASKRHQDRMNASEHEFSKFYTCKTCSNKFKSRSGIWRHLHLCKQPPSENINALNLELFNTLNEIKQQISMQNVSTTINNHTTNNKHIYLNDQFIESVKVDTNSLDVPNQPGSSFTNRQDDNENSSNTNDPESNSSICPICLDSIRVESHAPSCLHLTCQKCAIRLLDTYAHNTFRLDNLWISWYLLPYRGLYRWRIIYIRSYHNDALYLPHVGLVQGCK